MKWEYLIVRLYGENDTEDETTLTAFGLDEWELVSLVSNRAVFKRPQEGG